MAPPIKMKKPAVATPPPVDLSLEKPVLGNMNYAQKFAPTDVSPTYAAPGMPVNVKKKAVVASKNSGYLAMYKKGAKKVEVNKDREMAAPSVEAMSDEPTPYLSPEDSDPDLASSPLAAAPEQPKAPAVATPAPHSNYQEAAKSIKNDKELYSQYKAKVASGKAFSLNIGGKEFKYAATPKKGSGGQGNKQGPISQDKLRDTFYGDDSEPVPPKPLPTKAAAKMATTRTSIPTINQEVDEAYQAPLVKGSMVGKAASSIAAMPAAPKATPDRKMASPATKQSTLANLASLKATYDALSSADKRGAKGAAAQEAYKDAKKAAGGWAD